MWRHIPGDSSPWMSTAAVQRRPPCTPPPRPGRHSSLTLPLAKGHVDDFMLLAITNRAVPSGACVRESLWASGSQPWAHSSSSPAKALQKPDTLGCIAKGCFRWSLERGDPRHIFYFRKLLRGTDTQPGLELTLGGVTAQAHPWTVWKGPTWPHLPQHLVMVP